MKKKIKVLNLSTGIKDKMRIGILGNIQVGGTAMYFPLFYNLEKKFPNIQIDYICRSKTRINSTFLKPFKHIRLKLISPKDIFSIKRYDYIFALHPQNPVINFVFALIYSKKQIVSSDKKWPRLFFKNFSYYSNNYSSRINSKYHNHYLFLVNKFFIKSKNLVRHPLIKFDASLSILKKYSLVKNKFISISPYSQDLLRSLGESRLKSLIKKLNKKHIVVLVGVNKNHKQLELLNCVDLINKTSIPELISILSYSKANIVVETGMMHISAHLHKPTIALVRKVTPEQLCDDFENVINLTNDSVCNLRNKCKNRGACINSENPNICVKSIDFKTILDSIKKLKK